MIQKVFFSLILLVTAQSALVTAQSALAATMRVPQDHETIQTAIDASQSGDTILVAPGLYRERVILKPGIFLRSEGDDTKETAGLQRAEATVIDGSGKEGR